MAPHESPSKSNRPKSMFGVSLVDEIAGTPTPRPQGKLTKLPRPKSAFSYKSRDLIPPDSPRGVGSSASSSVESSTYDTPSSSPATISARAKVILSGELVTGGGLLRKKKEFVVLTERELQRFKSENKYVEVCESAPTQVRTHGRRGSSAASFADIVDHTLITRLDRIVAVFFTGPEAEAGSSIQVDYIDGSGSPGSVVFQAATPILAQGWVKNIRSAAFTARAESDSPNLFNEEEVAYVMQRLESERDYVQHRFLMYRIVQRASQSGKKTGSSVEDLQKMYSTIAFLAIGLHKIHIVPMKLPHKNSGAGVQTMAATSHALLNISAMSISQHDDSLSLTFR